MKDEHIQQAKEIIKDANVLINLVSRRVKELKSGSKPLVHSLERLDPEDIALREIIEGKIEAELYEAPAIAE